MFSTTPRIIRISAAVSVAATLSLTSVSVAIGATPKASKDKASAALVPAKYKSGIKVATDATYPPDEFVNSKGQITGFDKELIDAIGVTLGIKVTTQNVTFDNIIPGIKAGKYAVGNSSFTDTPERQKMVNFVDYFKAGEAFYTKSTTKNAPTTLATLCGSSVAVESGTVEETDALAQKKKCSVRVDSYATQTEADLAVKSGHDVVGFADSQVAGYIVAQSKGAFKLSGKPFGVAPYGIATAKTADGLKLAKAIQSAVRKLIKNGVYTSILAKYGETSGAVKAAGVKINGGK